MRALKITNSITRRDEKSLERYLTEISRFDVLTPEEELELFNQLKAGDKSALGKIVNHNLRFVVSVAKQYHFPGLWLGDLINEGNIGLVKAAHRFDVSKGFKFISYAVWWIRQMIIKAISDKSRKIRIPSNVQTLTNKVMDKRVEILQEKEREPSVEELAKATDLTIDNVKQCLSTYRWCSSLDAPVGEDGDATVAMLMADQQVKAPDHKVAVLESQQKDVAQMLSSLPPRQAEILSLYYGIGKRRSISLDDISQRVGVSPERVRQIKDRALHRLRRRYKNEVPIFSDN